jgi:predicted DNA-binding transcriptional regulator AlpA
MNRIKTLGGDTAQKTNYARAKRACEHFQIARSTLWQWSKTRDGFPKPLKAGERVTLFDINAIDAFLKAQAAK